METISGKRKAKNSSLWVPAPKCDFSVTKTALATEELYFSYKNRLKILKSLKIRVFYDIIITR